MRHKPSLRSRIFIAFILFSALTSALYGVFIHVSLSEGEDEIFNNRLKTEVIHFIEQYRENPQTPPPHSNYIKGYIGTSDMPASLQKLIQGLQDGYYETHSPFGLGGPWNLHVAVKKLPGRDKTLYLFYDIVELEITKLYQHHLTFTLLLGFLLVMGLGLLIGAYVSKRISAPLQSLVDHVNRTEPDNLPTRFPGEFKDKEMAILSRSLEQAMERIKTFIEREKQFTRDSSHELRTPVTVIKGAAELLRQHPFAGQGSAPRALGRIERAVRDMEETIETFLWLARGEASIEAGMLCEVAPLVQEAVERYQQEAEEKHIALELNLEAKPTIAAPPQIPHILLGNLLKNALHYTPSGKITVHVKADRVEISDSGVGVPESRLGQLTEPFMKGGSSTGFGLGLNIVKRLCDRFGWRLEIQSHENKGTTVQWILGPENRI